MALALIARLHGQQLAADVADRVELEWHQDPAWDPFAVRSGLVPD
jgi:transcriptional regulator GlxA family with amidase domain